MDVNQKDLVLISYPFSNLECSKVRPAIIVSNNFLNKKSDDCVAIPLTTIIKDEPFSIIINQQDLASGKLIKQSRARLDKIFSIEKSLIVKKIGIISTNLFEKIKSDFFKIF